MNLNNRQLRIFISSTFKDMQQERDQLIKYVFPKIKKLASERFVDITEIDLRWGITEEEANSGETLKICLDEIDKCKSSPVFFIGLLGNRYGWIPNDIDSNLFKDTRYKWIKEYKDKSVTELEILYAVLNEQNINQKSFFYFRDESLSNKIESELQMKSQDKFSEQKQNKLKTSIKNQIEEVYDYNSIESFSEKILEDLTNELDRLYPKNETPSGIDKTKLTHRQFANSRKKVYIKDQTIFDQIDQFLESDTPNLTIHAESGMGKSSLVANYVDYYELRYPDNYIIEHYIGGADDMSADIKQVLYRILNELKEVFKIYEELPKYEELLDKFATYMYNFQADKKIVIFIDAIDQLIDENEKRLYFLPRLLPKNIKMVISSIEPIELEVSTNIILAPLSHQNQINLINTYLHRFSKKLSPEQLDMILNSKQADNTLYLKTLLDELRIYGDFDNLTLKINRLMQNKTVEDLFTTILRRIEQDINHESFIDIMSLILCSRDGLSEKEILEIINGISIEKFQHYINQDRKLKLTQIELSNILLQLDDHIIYKDGLINFFHIYLLKAVKKLYLQGDEQFIKHRKKIADYFDQNYKKEDDIKRVASELPYQYYELDNEDKLLNTISNLNIFLAFYSEKWYFEILKYYLSIVNINKKKDIFLKKLLSHKVKEKKVFSSVYYFFNRYLPDKNILKQSIQFYKNIQNYDNSFNEMNVLSLLSQNYSDLGKYNEAKELNEKVLDLSIKTLGEEHKDTLTTMHNLSQNYSNLGKYNEAKELNKKVLDLSIKTLGEEHPNTLLIMNSLVTSYTYIEKYNEAKELNEKVLELSIKTLGEEHPDSLSIMHNLIINNIHLEHYDLAFDLINRSLELNEKVLGIFHPDTLSLYNALAYLYSEIGEYNESKKINEKLLDLRMKILGEEHPDTFETMSNLISDYIDIEEYAKVIKLSEINLDIGLKALGEDHPFFLIAKSNLAFVYGKLGDYKKERIILREVLTTQKKVFGENHPDTLETVNKLQIIDEKINQKSE